MPKLYIHIGTGKTGTTAIQDYLYSRIQDLSARNVHYWGINLEHAPALNRHSANRFAWQTQSGTGMLQQIPLPQARYELEQALRAAMDSLTPNTIAVWCNESIHERPELYIPLFKSCQADGGISITLFAYARNSRDYIRSAYKQWGVRHKTNYGRVLGFSQWILLMRKHLCYGEKLAQWDQEFPGAFHLINYDFLADVTHDFVSRLPQCTDLLPQQCRNRINATPADVSLALYALYNNQFTEPVTPTTIEDLLSRYQLLDVDFKMDSLAMLFPTSDDINDAVSALQSDANLVNSILERHGQPQLTLKECNGVEEDIVSEQSIVAGTMSLLLRILVEQEKRINALEQRTIKSRVIQLFAKYLYQVSASFASSFPSRHLAASSNSQKVTPFTGELSDSR